MRTYRARVSLNWELYTAQIVLPNSIKLISAKYNRTERLCADSSATANCYAHLSNALHVTLFSLFWAKRGATIRPVLKHGPRSSTGLRVVEYYNMLFIYLIRRSESKMVRTTFHYWILVQHRLITDMRWNWAYTFIAIRGGERLIKPKSILVETRKMVNYARTWWSQVKTWWKLALCGTDVQIVAAWPEYRGERLIEPSSSWFPPKFPLG